MSDHPIRVLLVDDQELLRAGFRIILGVQPDIEIVGEASTGTEAIAQTAALTPDVVCMDVQMPGMDGLEATRRIVADPALTAAVLILTTFDRDDYLYDALAAGASGFLLKNSSPEDLISAVRIVAEGDALLSPAVTRRVIEGFASRGRDARAGSAVHRGGGSPAGGGTDAALASPPVNGGAGTGFTGDGRAVTGAGFTGGPSDAGPSGGGHADRAGRPGDLGDALRGGGSPSHGLPGSGGGSGAATGPGSRSRSESGSGVGSEDSFGGARGGQPPSFPEVRSSAGTAASAALESLTEREREVLQLVAQGMSNAEVAAALYVGEATVKSHVSKVLQKLALRDRIQAVIFAYEQNIAAPRP